MPVTREVPVAVTVRFGNADLARCRFRVSPLWEVQNALRVLRDPHLHPALVPWLHRVRDRLAGLDLAPVYAVLPRRGYTPDLLAAPGLDGPATIAAQLAAVRATPVDLVANELARVGVRDTDDPSLLAELRADPAAARALLADLLDAVWQRLLAPDWQQVHDVLASDIDVRSRRMALRGLEGVLDDMHPVLRWAAPELRLEVPVRASVELAGRGLVLQPSVFTAPGPVVILDPPWQPTLVYPARGTATLAGTETSAPAAALGRLLGATRARLLLDLVEPTATTVLARRHGLSQSTVSVHLAALRDAGLVSTRRVGHSVLYVQTGLGTALCAGDASAG